MSSGVSRRMVLASAVGVAGTVIAARSGAATAPKESGLSSEGLLVGRPGFQPRTVMPLPHTELPGFLSGAQLAAHHEEYVRDVERLRETEDALRAADVPATRYAELRRRQAGAANAVLLHEFYFGGLAPTEVPAPRQIARHMSEHMGTFDSWRDDFTRCAMAAKTWAVLVYDPYDDRWHDVVMDDDHVGAWVGANPLVVCDVASHAFATDYSRREDYVAKFLDHVDWEEVSRRYKAVDRM
jgi:superoxide dismutase, Fe-Mn family